METLLRITHIIVFWLNNCGCGIEFHVELGYFFILKTFFLILIPTQSTFSENLTVRTMYSLFNISILFIHI